MRTTRLFWVLLCAICSLYSHADVISSGTIYLCPGQTTKIYTSSSSYNQDNGFNWRWELEPNYAATKLSETVDYCEIRAEQLEGVNAYLYFKYDYYYGATKVTAVYQWTLKHKTPPSYELKASPSGGEVKKGTKVYLSMYADGTQVNNDVNIYYTLDGSEPDRNSTKYTSSGITINDNCTLKAWGLRWYNGARLTETYTVKEPDPVLVSSITLNKPSLSLLTGQFETLSATVKPSNATDKTVTWSSDETSVATVNSSGLVTAVSAGSATITCTANDGSGVNAKCVVSVSSGGVAINTTNFPDDNFRNFLLNYDLGRDGVLTDSEIAEITTLYLNDRNIASLKGIEYFTSLVSLKCENNQLTSLDLSNNTALIAVYCQRNKIRNEGMDEFINSLPQHTGWRGVYLIDNTQNDEENVCTISQATKARNKMWLLFSRESSNSWKEYSGSEDPKPKPDNIVLLAEATVAVGQTVTLTPTVTPANAEYTLTWSSDDETVAIVSQDGVVTGVKKGQTFINVETDNGKTAYCKLTVTKDVTEKCATPTISYANGQLSFSCDTEDVEYVTEVTVADAKKYYTPQIQLSTVYTVSVYATKDGYENSDVATMEIKLANEMNGDLNGDGEVNITDVTLVLDIINSTK